MRRSPFILGAVVLSGLMLFTAAFFVGNRLCHHLRGPIDDLTWLRTEFSLTDTELDRIQQLHEAYLPVCEEFCIQIERAKLEMRKLGDAALENADDIQRMRQTISDLRSQCQAAMLKHFEAVSEEMPPEQGERYLAEMRRLTLDFHEQFEESMAGGSREAHAHH